MGSIRYNHVQMGYTLRRRKMSQLVSFPILVDPIFIPYNATDQCCATGSVFNILWGFRRSSRVTDVPNKGFFFWGAYGDTNLEAAIADLLVKVQVPELAFAKQSLQGSFFIIIIYDREQSLTFRQLSHGRLREAESTWSTLRWSPNEQPGDMSMSALLCWADIDTVSSYGTILWTVCLFVFPSDSSDKW